MASRFFLDDNMYAVVLGTSPIRLWGLTPAERVERQLRDEGIRLWRESLDALPADCTLLFLRGDCLYDRRVLRGLVTARQVLLEVEVDGRLVPVAAQVTAAEAPAVGELLRGGPPGVALSGVAAVTIDRLAQRFEAGLLKLDRPYVLPVTAENRRALEELAFSGAYKGVTDLVTKWLWPVPAKWATRWCVRLGITAQSGDRCQPGAGRRCHRAVRPRRVRVGTAGGLDHDLPRHRRRQARTRHGHLHPTGQHLRPWHRSRPSAHLVRSLGRRPCARPRGGRGRPAVPRSTSSYSPVTSAAVFAKAHSSAGSHRFLSLPGAPSIPISG